MPAQWSLGKAACLRRQVEEDLMAVVPGAAHATLEILPMGSGDRRWKPWKPWVPRPAAAHTWRTGVGTTEVLAALLVFVQPSWVSGLEIKMMPLPSQQLFCWL